MPIAERNEGIMYLDIFLALLCLFFAEDLYKHGQEDYSSMTRESQKDNLLGLSDGTAVLWTTYIKQLYASLRDILMAM